MRRNDFHLDIIVGTAFLYQLEKTCCRRRNTVHDLANCFRSANKYRYGKSDKQRGFNDERCRAFPDDWMDWVLFPGLNQHVIQNSGLHTFRHMNIGDSVF